MEKDGKEERRLKKIGNMGNNGEDWKILEKDWRQLKKTEHDWKGLKKIINVWKRSEKIGKYEKQWKAIETNWKEQSSSRLK